MSQSGLSAPASPDPDLSGTSSSIIEGQLYTNSRPESRSSISSNSMVDQDQAAESSRLSSNLDETDRKSDSGEVIGLDENAQSGGLLDEHKQDLMASDSSKEEEDSLEMVSDDEMETNENCKDSSSKKSSQTLDPLIKDTELDFEEDNLEEEPKKLIEDRKPEEDEDGECDGEKPHKEKEESEEELEGEDLEEGEVSSEEDVGKHARMEPRPVCRFYSKGNCTWGNNCRFVHPGVLDKGNYNMFAPARSAAHNGPSVPYERPFDRPPVVPLIPPAEWTNSQPRIANVRPPRHPQPAEPTRADAAGAESAWERGLRQAKEMLKKSNHRKETDIDFEEKKLNLGLGEEELDKENDYYTRPASPVLHGDVPPPFEEPDTEPYHKYPPPSAEGRWPPSRYPPPHRHPPPGYPYPYEGRRPYPPESEYREREYYHPEGYERPHYYGPKPSERDIHPSASKSQPQLPPPHEKRWPDERYVEVVPPAQRGRSDEWWDPWMRSRSPGGAGGGGAGGGGGPSSSAVGVAGGNSSGAKGSRRRSYSSGSSFSTSSSTSSSSSSSYSSSSSRSSRSSASSRSTSQSKSMNVKRRQGRKAKVGDQRVKGNHKTASSLPVAKHKTSSAPIPSSPPHPQTSRKPTDKQRNIHERSPQVRNRDWSSSSSRSRSRSLSKMRPATKNNSSAPPTKAHGGRTRASSGSSSSSEWESSPHSNDVGRPRRPSNRGRRDFAERKELRGVNPPPASSHSSAKGKAVPEPLKVETKQIKLTLKSTAPPLKKITNRFDDDSDDEGWEKEKTVSVSVPQPATATNSNQATRKRIAESPPPTAPPSKAANASPQKADKGGKKSAATRREELLKQLKAVEEAIAKKRSKLPV